MDFKYSYSIIQVVLKYCCHFLALMQRQPSRSLMEVWTVFTILKCRIWTSGVCLLYECRMKILYKLTCIYTPTPSKVLRKLFLFSNIYFRTQISKCKSLNLSGKGFQHLSVHNVTYKWVRGHPEWNKKITKIKNITTLPPAFFDRSGRETNNYFYLALPLLNRAVQLWLENPNNNSSSDIIAKYLVFLVICLVFSAFRQCIAETHKEQQRSTCLYQSVTELKRMKSPWAFHSPTWSDSQLMIETVGKEKRYRYLCPKLWPAVTFRQKLWFIGKDTDEFR